MCKAFPDDFTIRPGDLHNICGSISKTLENFGDKTNPIYPDARKISLG